MKVVILIALLVLVSAAHLGMAYLCSWLGVWGIIFNFGINKMLSRSTTDGSSIFETIYRLIEAMYYLMLVLSCFTSSAERYSRPNFLFKALALPTGVLFVLHLIYICKFSRWFGTKSAKLIDEFLESRKHEN